MKFDTQYIDLKLVETITICNEGILCFKISPINYNDGIRNPRLPRKSSRQTNLQIDTNFIFDFAFKDLKNYYSPTEKFKVEIIIFKSNDKLGGGDLDNYCKAILDGITKTQKIWNDDKQVDEILLKRNYIRNSFSYIELKINKLL